jgi:hypothetical protein
MCVQMSPETRQRNGDKIIAGLESKKYICSIGLSTCLTPNQLYVKFIKQILKNFKITFFA